MTTKTVYVLDRRRNLIECDMIVYESDTGVFTLADGTVVAAEVAANSITEAQIALGALTTASLNPAAGITSGQLAGSIAQSKLAGGILSTQLAAGVAKVLSGTVTYNDGKSANPIITIPANALVTDVIAVCTTAFNGTAVTIDLGDDSNASNFIGNANVGLTLNAVSGQKCSDRGSNLWLSGTLSATTPFGVSVWPTPLRKFYAATNHLNSTLGYTGTSKGTAGAMTVYLAYIALA